MSLSNRLPKLLTYTLIFLFSISATLFADEKSKHQKAAKNLIWQNPGDIRSRNLFWGAGSEQDAPVPPFQFIEEDKDGESPKFKVRDARGREWAAKLGVESQSETVATRLVWAVGYFVEPAYYFEQAQIQNLPRLSRGNQFIEAGGVVHGVRFEPRHKHIKRGDYWDWSDNPFADTRELNGLKVLMILLNNYDARTQNNRILIVQGENGLPIENRYVVTDLGATLGKAAGMGGGRSKNTFEDFIATKFVLGTENGIVKFDFDTRPTKLGTVAILNPIYYRGEVKKERDMRDIPVEHARWIGSLLSELTDEQLHDMFRAAKYEAQIRENFVRVLRERIHQLSQL
jgi:hypothetical protein